MKILPIIKSINSDIRSTSNRVSKAGREGLNIGMRTSQIYKQGEISTILNVSKSVKRKVLKGTTIDDLPIIAGALGMFVPLPLASPLMLAAGKIIQIAVKKVRLHKP